MELARLARLHQSYAIIAQMNGTGLDGERTPLAVHPKKNSSFLDFA